MIIRSRRSLLAITLAVVASAAVLGYQATTGSAATAGLASVTIDFSQVIRQVNPNAFSGTISTYGESGGNIVDSAKQRTELGNLGLASYRVPLKWNGGNIISSAGGGPTTISGDQWVSSIRAFGGTPMIVLGGSSDNNFTPSDGANMVRHFSGTNRVGYWVIGNEPGNSGMSIGTYCTLFKNTVSAMKAVDPTIKVAGPAWAHFDSKSLQQFLKCAGNSVDIIDYHHYAMGSTYLDSTMALAQTMNYESEVNQVRSMINATVPARASQIDIQVGEYNWSWTPNDGYPGAYQGDDRFYQAVSTVWGASVAGHIAKAGGVGHQYADQNGPLSETFEKLADAKHFGRQVNDPMPVYWGTQMFTGGSLFRRFGATMVQASTFLPNVEVYASAGPDNVVLINKDPALTQTAVVQTTGVTPGAADVWQTNRNAPFAAPMKKGTVTITGGQAQVTLPPYSVTTLILTSAAPSPTATSSSTAQPGGRQRHRGH